MSTRTACVIAGVSPDEVAGLATNPAIMLRANRLGTLATGKPGDLVIDFAYTFAGPVYDIMWNADTNWFAVTIYRGSDVTRWDNRPGTDPGFPRVEDVLGATTPRTILDALDVTAEDIGYAEA